MARDVAVVLNSGSLNSAVITALAQQRYRAVMLHAETRARPDSRLRAAYEEQVAHFKPFREHLLAMPFLEQVASSGPAAGIAADPRQGALLGRRLLDLLPLVSLGVRYAWHHEAAAVYLGLRVGPGADELAQAMEFSQMLGELIQLSCGVDDLEIVMPLLELEPWQVVDLGHQAGAPLGLGWSCYEESAEPCGTCRGCRNRQAAFQQAAKADPAAKGK